MNAHFGDAFADRLAIAEISKFCAREASQNSGLCFLVGQLRQPLIEIGRPKQGVQVNLLYPTGYGYASTIRLKAQPKQQLVF
jgi:hypothetical protein